MGNPYRNRPAYTFWKSGVSEQFTAGIDPVVPPPFIVARSEAVATAGSCFAQHIARTLVERGFNYLVTERFRGAPGTHDENYGVFPARFGNVYTSRQLLQLFDHAYGLRVPKADAWRGTAGEFIDPFRPRVQAAGYPSIELLHADRQHHLAAVQRMFEGCQLFIFTLGLTETWMDAADGSAFPLAPGVVACDVADDAAVFRNLGVAEIVDDLNRFLDKFRAVNPTARVILTVSPVSLIATYEDRHVLVSTIVSKSILRAAADEICRQHQSVAYFPSYEIVTGPQTGGRFYAPDLREVTPEGVAFVMSIFARHYLGEAPSTGPMALAPVDRARATPATGKSASTGSGPLLPTEPAAPGAAAEDAQVKARMVEVAAIVCDEEAIAH